jgi:hypothetical protein
MAESNRNERVRIFLEESVPVEERFGAIGLRKGEKRDIRDLMALRDRYSFEIYLYLDERLAKRSTLKDDLRDFEMLPVLARPFVRIDDFLRFLQEREPDYEERWRAEPLLLDILEFGLLEVFYGCVLCRTSYVKCLLPE